MKPFKPTTIESVTRSFKASGVSESLLKDSAFINLAKFFVGTDMNTALEAYHHLQKAVVARGAFDAMLSGVKGGALPGQVQEVTELINEVQERLTGQKELDNFVGGVLADTLHKVTLRAQQLGLDLPNEEAKKYAIVF